MVSRLFKDAAKAAGFDLSLHALRHSCASRLAQRGIPLATIATILEHRCLATTQRYASHVPKGAAHDAIKVLGRPVAAEKDTQGDTQASVKASG